MLKPFSLAAGLVFSLLAASVGCNSESPTDPIRATQASAAKPAPPKPKLLPGARTRVLEAAGDLDYDKTFDDLRFDIEVGETFERKMLTESIEAMNGKPIRIRG